MESVSTENGTRWGEFNKLLYNQTPDPVMLRNPPGACHLPLLLPPCLSFTRFPSFPLGLCRSAFLWSPSFEGTLPLSLVSAGSPGHQARPRSSGARAYPLPRSLCLLWGRLPAACGFLKCAGLRLGPSGKPHPLVPGGARSLCCHLFPSAHHLGGPLATEGTDHLPPRLEPPG